MAKKIMMVDDEESIRMLVSAVLQREGYEIILAVDGSDCIDKLRTTKPDLVLLDMMMPNMSGREVLEAIRADKNLKSQKVAFLTVARFSEAGINTLKKLNALDYITKPFDNADLIKRVKKII